MRRGGGERESDSTILLPKGKTVGEEDAGGSGSGSVASGIKHQDRLGDRDKRTTGER